MIEAVAILCLTSLALMILSLAWIVAWRLVGTCGKWSYYRSVLSERNVERGVYAVFASGVGLALSLAVFLAHILILTITGKGDLITC